MQAMALTDPPQLLATSGQLTRLYCGLKDSSNTNSSTRYVALFVPIFSQDSPFICPIPSRRFPSPDTLQPPLLEMDRSVPGASAQSHSVREFPRFFAGSLPDRT